VNSGAKPRILVVDDDPSLQKLVEVLLQRAGMDSIQALNASEAARFLRDGPLPDLVILDLMLPDISGIDFLRQMREKKIFDDLPVLILSALADPDQIREGLSNGADRYITKPYLANNLIATVQDLLRTGRKRD
jgi:two-component system phosphate regulon response regulator PhoB